MGRNRILSLLGRMFHLPVDRPIPTKSTGQFGLSARGSYSELRGKLVLGLGASLEAKLSLLRVFPIKAPYYI
jgi:hypothetical protein